MKKNGRKITIREVARTAGVGLGTVSRVLNKSPLVNEATRQRVEQVIRELNYFPNPTARRLSMGRTLTISVIAPFFTRPAFVERLRGIEHALAESDYDLVLYNVETVKRRDECFQQVLHKERNDGVIILSLSPRDDDIPLLLNAGMPVVLVDANHPSLNLFNRVVVDDVAGGRLAVQHLIDLGHRRIGYISDYLESPFNFTSSRDRYTGYRQALEQAGIALCPEYHGQGEHGRYPARVLTMRMLALPNPPTAIFAASDTQAMGVLEAAHAAGLTVPQDLSVIGYDDIEVAEYLGLTTIRQLLYESGRRGVELLLNELQGPLEKPICEVFPTELVLRNTTAPPRH